MLPASNRDGFHPTSSSNFSWNEDDLMLLLRWSIRMNDEFGLDLIPPVLTFDRPIRQSYRSVRPAIYRLLGSGFRDHSLAQSLARLLIELIRIRRSVSLSGNGDAHLFEGDNFGIVQNGGSFGIDPAGRFARFLEIEGVPIPDKPPSRRAFHDGLNAECVARIPENSRPNRFTINNTRENP